MPRKRSALSRALIVLALGASLPAAASSNLLTNPNFDSSLAGWQTVGATSWLATLDANGSPLSGSALGVFDSPTVTGLVPVLSQCVALTPPVLYHLGGQIFIPGGQSASGSAYFLLIQYPTTDCSGPPPPGPFLPTPAVTVVNAWTPSLQTLEPFGRSGRLFAYLAPSSGGHLEAAFDNLVLAPGPVGCTGDPTTLCLLDSRFRVTATFDTGHGSSGAAHALPIGDSGDLWFFAPGNIEAVVKMIDGCTLNSHFWFFAAGLTNVQVVITVTDTRNGLMQTYTNPGGTAFQPIQDTAAFGCP